MFGPPSTEELQLQYTMEYDVNSPRLRISVASYLLENGVTPASLEQGVEEFTNIAEGIVEFIAGNRADFITALEAVAIDSSEDVEQLTEDAEDSGYNYL